jgi:choice-of-anchor B domain-containing protein
MIRLLFLLAMVLATLTTNFSQAFNTTLRGQLSYSQNLNDIWGYAAPDGTEYALVGTRTGFSIVSLADHDSPVEVAFIPGDASTWRDIKTYGTYAYVTTDTGDDGLLIVDLSDLPNSAPFEYVNVGIAGSDDVLLTAHNIFIDTLSGIAYISGGNYNGGGMVLYDVATNPGEAIFVNAAPNIYSHDVYVQDNLMYASEIFDGNLAIYDVSDPLNIGLLGTRVTPFAFTHNAWTTADGNYVFTTDERGDAPTAAYDITDPGNPVLIDEFRPSRSVGSGVIPHNAHVLNEYVIISHYTDGLEIADASVPGNMVEVAYYDTWGGGNGGFSGCWGAYPFLPSGLVLATDITNGLYVVEVDYKRAARLKGNVTDANTSAMLNNVSIAIDSPEEAAAATDASGLYQTGVANAGTFEVTFSLLGYGTQTQNVELVEGQEIVLDVALQPLTQIAYTGTVVSAEDGSPIANASVLIEGTNGTLELATDVNGLVNINAIFIGDYIVYAGKWGWVNAAQNIVVAEGSSFTIELEAGYADGFVVDQGWTTEVNAASGFWTRAVPNGTTSGGDFVNPGSDSDNALDLGNKAFVTGNSAQGGVGGDDIDDGTVTLVSPSIDLNLVGDTNIVVSYDYWFYNGGGGSGDPDDVLRVFLDNGSEAVEVTEYFLEDPNTVSSAWTAASFNLDEVNIDLTGELRFIVVAEDEGDGHLSEAGLDNFRITGEFAPSNTSNFVLAGLEVDVFPNPTAALFSVNYSLPFLPKSSADLEVTDVQGRVIQQVLLPANTVNGTIELGANLAAGTYVLRLMVDGAQAYTTKVVKQ